MVNVVTGALSSRLASSSVEQALVFLFGNSVRNL